MTPKLAKYKNPAAFEIDSEVGTLRLALQGLRSIEDALATSHENRVAIQPNTAFMLETAIGQFVRMVDEAATTLDGIASEEVTR